MRAPPNTARSPKRLRTGVATLLVGAAIVISLAPAAGVAAQPRDPHIVAVVFPPWWTAARSDAVVAAIGVVRPQGSSELVRVVYGGPDLIDELKAAGAWLIVDPAVAGCLTPGNWTS
jgi:multidrug efflux pump subunit AcrA (membrane-fusion protein)